MCMVKTPKPVASNTATDKPIQVLRNPYLDGIDPLVKARQSGMGSLRIDRGSGKAPVTGLPGAGPRIPPRTTPTAPAGTSPQLTDKQQAVLKFLPFMVPGGASIARQIKAKATAQ